MLCFTKFYVVKILLCSIKSYDNAKRCDHMVDFCIPGL